jgi:hypothetical protein
MTISTNSTPHHKRKAIERAKRYRRLQNMRNNNTPRFFTPRKTRGGRALPRNPLG